MKARALLLFFTIVILFALAVPLVALADGGGPTGNGRISAL
jgi:hypothetical protein